MRVPVTEAMHSSKSAIRKARKEDAKAKAQRIAVASGLKASPAKQEMVSEPDAATGSKPVREGKTEFEKASVVRRINDVVQQPPTITKLPRGAARQSVDMGKKTDGVVSLAQKHMMEIEREKAIKRYRELKEQRMNGNVT